MRASQWVLDDSVLAKSPISEQPTAGLRVPWTPWLQDRPFGSAGWAAHSAAGPCRVWLHGGQQRVDARTTSFFGFLLLDTQHHGRFRPAPLYGGEISPSGGPRNPRSRAGRQRQRRQVAARGNMNDYIPGRPTGSQALRRRRTACHVR